MPRPIDLMIVGAQKAGTSSLGDYLERDARVHGHPQRELTYFVLPEEHAAGYEAAFARYFGHGPRDDQILLAKSAGLLGNEAGLRRLVEHNPAIRATLLLRDPADRAYSAYWYARRMGWEPLESFEAALAAESGRLAVDPFRWRHCAYVARGLYGPNLAQLHALVAPERVSVDFLDDLKHDAARVCRRVLEPFGIEYSADLSSIRVSNPAARARLPGLAARMSSGTLVPRGVRSLVPQRVRGLVRRALRRANETSFTPPPMQPETRAALANRFGESDAQLASLIGRSLPWRTE